MRAESVLVRRVARRSGGGVDNCLHPLAASARLAFNSDMRGARTEAEFKLTFCAHVLKVLKMLR